MPVELYHETTPRVNPLTWPAAIRTEHVEFLVANLADLGAWVEVGPTTHARSWNTLHLPDGTNYTTHSAGPWWTLGDNECSCYDLPDGRAHVCAACKRRLEARHA